MGGALVKRTVLEVVAVGPFVVGLFVVVIVDAFGAVDFGVCARWNLKKVSAVSGKPSQVGKLCKAQNSLKAVVNVLNCPRPSADERLALLPVICSNVEWVVSVYSSSLSEHSARRHALRMVSSASGGMFRASQFIDLTRAAHTSYHFSRYTSLSSREFTFFSVTKRW